MPNAIVMTGYGPPEVLQWAGVPLPEPGEGQIRIKVKAAGISPTDLALRAGYLKAIPLPPDAVLGFEAAGTVNAVGLGVTGTSVGDGVTALLFSLGGYAEYAVASIWARKPDTVSWIDAAALPSSAEAAAGVLRQLNVTSGETLLLFGGGGSVGIIATQLAVARGATVISAVGEHDETLARELGATPVRYGAGLAGRVRALGPVDAVFDGAGQGVLADAIALAGGPKRVITLSDPAAADFGGDADGFAALAALVRPGGTAVTTKYVADPGALAAAGATGTNFNFAQYVSGELLEQVADALVGGRIAAPPIARITLEQAPAALNPAQAGRADGKTVITL